MPVRNEAWCLGLSLRVALMWCDEVLVLLHECTDGGASEAIVDGLEDGLRQRCWKRRINGEWDEMQHRQMLLERARERGATHVAMIDADEVLTGNLLPVNYFDNVPQAAPGITYEGIRGQCAILDSGTVLQLPGYNLRGSLTRYHANGIWGNRWFSLAFKDDPALHWAGDRFHAREPQGKTLQPYRPIQQGQGGVMHLWGVSERRLRAKHALYVVTERLRWPKKSTEEIGNQYSLWRTPADSIPLYPAQREWHQPWTFADVPESWWEPYAHLMRYIDLEAEPWQEAECRRLVEEHGRERFTGLDLFGVV